MRASAPISFGRRSRVCAPLREQIDRLAFPEGQVSEKMTPWRLRSLLFVPGDRPERMVKALGCGADALILDLEDSVALARKGFARSAVAEFLGHTTRSCRLLVRLNALDGGLAEDDLNSLRDVRPDALVLPKAEGAASIQRLARLSAEAGLGDVPVLPITAETPTAVFRLAGYRRVTERLVGLTWGAEDLRVALGATLSRREDGRFTDPFEVVRTLTLVGAASAEVAPIETVFPDFRDLEGLKRYASRGARDGFSGMLAIHPSQVAVINAAFTPSPEVIVRARRIVDAFTTAKDVGALQLDGVMVDAPHLRQARRTLRAADL
jgi:citrate lyase subunit beta / citryl-CoA lyase